MDDVHLHDRSNNNALVKTFFDSEMDIEGMRYALQYHSCSGKVKNRDYGNFKHGTSKYTERVGWLAFWIEGSCVEREGYWVMSIAHFIPFY